MGKKLGASGQEGGFPGRAESQGAPALIAAILIFALLFILAWYFFLKPQVREEEGGRIEVFLEGGKPFFANTHAVARAFSSCGPFALYLDSERIAQGDERAEASISPPPGRHTLLARSASCVSALDFLVVEKQCEEGDSYPCFVNGCEGVKKCIGGLYSDCILPRKVCVPGERTGCSTDGCKFGYAICNSCGTGFGKCLPAGSAQACSSPDCT